MPNLGARAPNQNFTFFDPEIFAVREINRTYYDCRHEGPLWNGNIIVLRPLFVWTLGGTKRYSSNSIFSVTAIDIGTILSQSHAPFLTLQSSPKIWGRCPLVWGQDPPKKNSRHVTLRFLGIVTFCLNSAGDRGCCPLTTVKFRKKSLGLRFEILGIKFLGGVALWRFKVLVAPPGKT